MTRHPIRSAPSSPRRGFALLITITLLAFLVLLLVSLAALTRVETQVASNNQQVAQARQNALMALNIAVGQLQKYAGPDQRTTARADLQNTPGQTNAHWTGIYGSSVVADYDADPVSIAVNLTASTNLTTTGSPARLLNWLVSGNEPAAFNPAWGTGDVGPKGEITRFPDPASATAIPFKPNGEVAGLTPTTPATSTTITIRNANNQPKPARLLVGENSVTSSVDASGRPIDYVVAPTVDIEAPASQLGLGGNAPVPVGRYAWWVGDDGMKARVNLPLAGTDPDLSDSDKLEQQRNAFSNSTRAAIELMAADTPNWSASPSALDATQIGALYNPAHDTLKPILSSPQLPLASNNSTSMAAALKYRFHDVTAQSISVLSDTYAGGLKRDLSILLDSSYNPAASDPTADLNRMWVKHTEDTTGFATGGGFAIPTWRHLRSFVQTRVPTTGLNTLSVPVRLPTHDKPNKTTIADDADHVGAAPVITYFSLGFRAAPAAAPAPGVEIHMNLYPLVVIWNPYNVTLRAPAPQSDGSNFEVGVQPTHDGQVSVELEAEVAGTWTSRGRFNFQRTHYGNNGNFIRFRLKCPDIPPGQSLIFSLPVNSSGQIYNQRNILENIEPEPGAYVSVPFRSGPAGSPTNITIQTGEENLSYRLSKSPGTQSNSFVGGGGILIYLGEPSNLSSITTTGGTPHSRDMFNPSATNRRWYSVAQGIDWSGLVVTLPFQEPGPLVHDPIASEPTYVFQTQALFSGEGSNAQLNANQYMFATRWLAQGNMRAVRSDRTRRDNNYNVLFTATAGQPLYTFPWQKFINGPGTASNRTSAGQGHDWLSGAPVDVGVFEFPYENQPLQSIGQLQHANLSLVGAYPAYPVGNSLADFRLTSGGSRFAADPQPAGWQLSRVDTGTSPEGTRRLGSDMRGYYDISYFLNRNLWDRYYFSTVPATGTLSATQTFPNTRHTRYDTEVDVQNPDRSAAGLMLAGGFNINSTSEQAWRAVLGGGNQLAYDPEDPEFNNSSPAALKTTFSRFTRPNGDDDPNDVWKGYRSLDENEVAQLARNIVAQIRNRGPFVSLSDFINRRLVDNTSTSTEDETYRGVIQAAIDATTTPSASTFPANDGSDPFWSQDQLISSSGPRVNQTSQYDMGYYNRAIVEGRRNATAPAERPYGGRSAFAPKYITQADILSKIGASLSGRSDTFTIRTYGEVVNPVTDEITGRAWCEAVVQRLPDYVEDPTVNPWDTPIAGSSSQTFGRKFKIISFRWLSPSDI
jgi:hypothetical protein